MEWLIAAAANAALHCGNAVGGTTIPDRFPPAPTMRYHPPPGFFFQGLLHAVHRP